MTVFSYNPYSESGRSDVVFQYGALVQQAIDWKLSPEGAADDITVHFAIYKLARDVYINAHEGTEGYGEVSGDDFAGGDSDKLIYLLVKAARAGIRVKLVYHNPTDDDDVEDSEQGIREYLLEHFYDDCSVRPNCDIPLGEGALEVHRVNWPHGKTTGQHHNKFMLISKYGHDRRDGVYVSTANVDAHEDFAPSNGYVQSGVLISEHPQLFDAYRDYFDIVWEASNSVWETELYPPANNEEMHEGFIEAVRETAQQANHAEGTLNYSDDRFRAFFYPLPGASCGTTQDKGDAWSITHNPVAQLVERLRTEDQQNRYVKINMYHLKNDSFGAKLHNALEEIVEDSGSYTMDIKAAIHKDSAGGTQANFGAWGLEWDADTHAKNYSFAFSGERNYFMLTGSTNGKWDAYCSKANNQLMIREDGVVEDGEVIHPLYDDFLAIFKNAYERE